MAEIIKVSSEEMRQTVSQFTSAQSTLEDAYTWMNRSLNVLDSCWKGPAYIAMRTKWNLIYRNIETANERMQDAIDELNASANLFEATESNLSSGFGALEAGNSPFD